MKNFTIIPPIRGNDVHGSGAYQAPRGNRKHNGIDLSCYKGSMIMAVSDGKVSKIGYPYNPQDPLKGHLRYIEVTDKRGYRVRYFYVDPTTWLNTIVNKGLVLGKTQDLTAIYKGITNHVHIEVKLQDGSFLNPDEYLKLI